MLVGRKEKEQVEIEKESIEMGKGEWEKR